jgi:chromosome segregation ATPase
VDFDELLQVVHRTIPKCIDLTEGGECEKDERIAGLQRENEALSQKVQMFDTQNEVLKAQVRDLDDRVRGDNVSRQSIRGLQANVIELSGKLSEVREESKEKEQEFEDMLRESKTLQTEIQKQQRDINKANSNHVRALQGRSTKQHSKKQNAIIAGIVSPFVCLAVCLSVSMRMLSACLTF